MRILIILFFVFISFFLLSYAKSDKAIPIEYIKVSSLEENNYKRYYGTIKAQFVSNLSFQTEGRIVFLPYTKGDFVKKGQVLARLDGELYKIRKNEEQARLQETIVQYNKNKNYFNRMDVLHKEGAISDNDWEDAYFGLKALDTQIKTQKQKIKYLEKEIDYNIILAPFNGFIADKMSEVGNYAKIGEPILTLINSNETQIEFLVDSLYVNSLTVGQNVIVEVQNKTYSGKIYKISKTNKNYGGYLVKVSLFKNYPDIKDGMSAVVLVKEEKSKDIYVPIECLFEENNNWYVYKIVDVKSDFGIIKKANIELGEIYDGKAAILKGIYDDDLIAVGNLSKLKDKAKVKL